MTTATQQPTVEEKVAKKPAHKTVKKTVRKTTVKKSVKKTTVNKTTRQNTRKATTPAKAASPTAAGTPGTDLERRLTRAGDFRFAIQHDGLARTYRVHIPARYDPSDPAPLTCSSSA